MLLLLLGAGHGCAPAIDGDRQARLTVVGFDRLTGWQSDRLGAVLAPFQKSCRRFLRIDQGVAVGPKGMGGAVGDWHAACRAALSITYNNDAAARNFFEKWFQPFEVSGEHGDTDGLFTGYYEPELRGSKTRSARYQVPLYGRPRDLVTVELGRFDGALSGRHLTGRIDSDRLLPYPTRSAIEGNLASVRAKPLVWVDSAVDAFFLHIQGSGRIRLADGSILRLGYAASNGRAYTAIGKILINRGHISRDRVSMQSIRAWLAANPGEASEIMAQNDRYVFFRLIPGEGPIGAQGVALTSGRSLAVDRTRLPLGAPFWVETRDPVNPALPFRRLMIAQDTGSAIRGAVRGDIFFGHGRLAARQAGLMKQRGRYFILLPKAGAPAS